MTNRTLRFLELIDRHREDMEEWVIEMYGETVFGYTDLKYALTLDLTGRIEPYYGTLSLTTVQPGDSKYILEFYSEWGMGLTGEEAYGMVNRFDAPAYVDKLISILREDDDND